MSMELMVKAMKTKVGNPLRKLVLLKLADNASDQGECWPSYQYIADQCEISRRAVVSHIDALIKTGVLSKTLRKGEKGNSSNIYLLNFHLLKPIYNDKDSLIGYLLPSESNALDSADPALGGESDALGDGALDAPRTSHSLEPVKEPIKESKPKKLAKPSLRTRMIDFYSTSIPESSIDDALEHRRAKGAANTERSHTMFFNEVLRCSQDLQITPSAVIDIVIQRDWKSVDTEWVRNHLRQARPAAPVIQNQPTIAPPNSRQAVSDSITDIHDTDW